MLRNRIFYLDQRDMSLRHVSDDGLHLNKYGCCVLKINLLQCFHTYKLNRESNNDILVGC